LFITYDTPAAAASIPVPYLALLDLATGEGRVIWRPPDSAWLSGVDLSPDRSELAISYAPPPPPGMLQSGRPGLYLLPADCLPAGCPNATPQPIVEPTDTDSYFEPVWSADGASLYLSHISTPAGATVPVFSVERVSGSGGPPELLIPNATWPRPSPDGSILAYVAFDVAQYINDLYFAAPDGSNAWPPVPPGFFISVDAPIFSPDGQTLYFSAAGSDPSSSFGSLWPDHRSWLERLTGVQPAYANGMPSEWWRLAVGGGTPERLTSIAASGLSGGFSPDGRFFAFVSYSGMGIMAADGSQFTGMFPVIAMGNVIWLP
jgi:Tol biopolymer transport system component